MWKRLTHPNIAPLLGITITPFQLISNWMSGGSLPGYIKTHPDANRLVLVSAATIVFVPCLLSHQLSDTAKGLCYLHSCNLIHGNLKGVRGFPKSCSTSALIPRQVNVLMDDSGRARITDFGLATVTQNLDSVRTISLQRSNTPRWTAPEVLKGGRYSKEADIFAFAMVMIEVRHESPIMCRPLVYCRFESIQAFTHAVPFYTTSSVTAMLAIMNGKRPPRPTHPTFTEDLWTLMQRCWHQDPTSRPQISEVVQILTLPFRKRLTSRTLAADERIGLLATIFSDDDQVKMIRPASGNDTQTFIDVIYEVSPCTISCSKDRVIHLTRSFTFRQLDVGYPSARDPQEVSTLFIQDLRPPRPSSTTTSDSALL